MTRRKRYLEKNRLFAVWLPQSINAQFEDYIQHYCQGDSTSARFRIFLYELLSLEQRGITLVNPIKSYEHLYKEKMVLEYGTAKPDEICLRVPAMFAKQDDRGKDLFCMYCRDAKKQEYKACQELRAEIRKKLKEMA